MNSTKENIYIMRIEYERKERHEQSVFFFLASCSVLPLNVLRDWQRYWISRIWIRLTKVNLYISDAKCAVLWSSYRIVNYYLWLLLFLLCRQVIVYELFLPWSTSLRHTSSQSTKRHEIFFFSSPKCLSRDIRLNLYSSFNAKRLPCVVPSH